MPLFNKKPGDRLHAWEVNVLGKYALAQAGGKTGSNVAGKNTGEGLLSTIPSPWKQYTIKVVRRYLREDVYNQTDETDEEKADGEEYASRKFPFYEILDNGTIRVTPPYGRKHSTEEGLLDYYEYEKWLIEIDLSAVFNIRREDRTCIRLSDVPGLKNVVVDGGSPQYVLGLDANGCIHLYPVDSCTAESSVSSSSSMSSSSRSSSSSISASSESSVSTSSSSLSSASSSSSQYVGDLFVVSIRYHNFEEGKWVERDDEWILDSTGLGLRLKVGDRLVAWWDAQRSCFIPAWIWSPASMIDLNGTDPEENPIYTTNDSRSDIRFALEVSDDDGATWKLPNGRVCKINGNVVLDNYNEASASGSVHYSVLVGGVNLLRVLAETDIEEDTGTEGAGVFIEKVALRIRSNTASVKEPTRDNTVMDSGATLIPVWTLEAEVENV